ncbi:isochorismatase family protein [Streptomyces sp. NPDC058682]|uniref:isochorismatase family protein n=1 Tax=unclassified Streptomyces TaxID=2593676 RepID=UPI00225B6D0E|nr:isochorismatase family protein [Streptomyces sp. NBC_01214]MCX4804475.1 isochorismatase family protein [Streptomyces sp. NBC_01214]
MAGLPPIAPYPLPTAESLPENLAQWTPDPERAVLLVHDMQRYFLNALPDPLRTELVHNTAQLRKRCAAAGVPVAYTAQPGRMTDEERGLLKDFWGPGMRTDPADRAVTPELAPAEGDWTFTKWRYSAFFRSELLPRMRAEGRDQLILCGVYAHVGILATALDAFTHDIQPFLAADALGDFSEDDHRLALDYAARRCAMVVLSAKVFA